MSFQGDIGELGRMAASLRAKGRGVDRIGPIAVPGLRAVQAAQIGARTSPYGEGWAPLAHGGQAQTDIAARVSLEAEGRTIVTETDAVAGYHHSGTSKMPARPLIPSERQGIPTAWTKQLDAAADKAVGERGRP